MHIITIAILSISLIYVVEGYVNSSKATPHDDENQAFVVNVSDTNEEIANFSLLHHKQKHSRARKERKYRKMERRKNRSRLTDKLKKNDDISFEVAKDADELAISSEYSTNQFPSNLEWLARNLSSIWQMLNAIHLDVKQIKRYHRLEDRKANRKSQQENIKEDNHPKQIELEEKEDCDPQYYQDVNTCSDKNGTVCGGNGMCSCGQCKCKESYYGYQCQCNDNSCASFDGKMCGGPERGQCRCGMCVCRPGFIGNSCDCINETSGCSSKKGYRCSNQGNCICNRCHCHDGFSGSTCENSIYSAKTCEEMKLCVLCLAFGKSYPQCADCNLNVKIVNEIEPSRDTCVMIHSNCLLKYSYTLPPNRDGSTDVSVQKSKIC